MNGTSRDVGLKSTGPGKGDSPRNISAKFYENFDDINFFRVSPVWSLADERQAGFARRGNKLQKVYR